MRFPFVFLISFFLFSDFLTVFDRNPTDFCEAYKQAILLLYNKFIKNQ